ncbi:MAG: ATP synthase subunit I, partial [Acidobacteria bacterium]|nr:ATP synthase subunit I [Acidobacteriota bacterium]
WMLVLALGGSAVALGVAGGRAAVGFLLGSVASYFNFRWLKRLVEALGPDGKSPARGEAMVLGGRYFLFGILGYVIVKYFEVSPLAALVGFLVVVGAVILEILYELIYAGT